MLSSCRNRPARIGRREVIAPEGSGCESNGAALALMQGSTGTIRRSGDGAEPLLACQSLIARAVRGWSYRQRSQPLLNDERLNARIDSSEPYPGVRRKDPGCQMARLECEAPARSSVDGRPSCRVPAEPDRGAGGPAPALRGVPGELARAGIRLENEHVTWSIGRGLERGLRAHDALPEGCQRVVCARASRGSIGTEVEGSSVAGEGILARPKRVICSEGASRPRPPRSALV